MVCSWFSSTAQHIPDLAYDHFVSDACSFTGRTKAKELNGLNKLNAELQTICHLLALLAHHISHVCGLRVNELNTVFSF
jgi:hypothetical protein